MILLPNIFHRIGQACSLLWCNCAVFVEPLQHSHTLETPSQQSWLILLLCQRIGKCQTAIVQSHSMWKRRGQCIAVCDAQQGRIVFRSDLQQQFSNLFCCYRIKISSRLVREQQ